MSNPKVVYLVVKVIREFILNKPVTRISNAKIFSFPLAKHICGFDLCQQQQ
jgi:hypothetical protein